MDKERAEMIWELMDSADMYTSYVRFCEERNITYIQPSGDMTIGLMTALMNIYNSELSRYGA